MLTRKNMLRHNRERALQSLVVQETKKQTSTPHPQLRGHVNVDLRVAGAGVRRHPRIRVELEQNRHLVVGDHVLIVVNGWNTSLQAGADRRNGVASLGGPCLVLKNEQPSPCTRRPEIWIRGLHERLGRACRKLSPQIIEIFLEVGRDRKTPTIMEGGGLEIGHVDRRRLKRILPRYPLAAVVPGRYVRILRRQKCLTSNHKAI